LKFDIFLSLQSAIFIYAALMPSSAFRPHVNTG